MNAQDRAERQILGLLLLHPIFWHEVQQNLHVEHFTDEMRRRLAQIFWDHCRNEGDPIFSEFLTPLNQAGLAELAINLVEECQPISEADVAKSLSLDIEYIQRADSERQARLFVSKLKDKSAPSEEQVLRDLMELAKGRKKNI